MFTFGNRWLSSCHFCPRAASRLSPPISNPRLLRKARLIASLKESGNTCPLALPSGTLLENTFCDEAETSGADTVALPEYEEEEPDSSLELLEFPELCCCGPCEKAYALRNKKAAENFNAAFLSFNVFRGDVIVLRLHSGQAANYVKFIGFATKQYRCKSGGLQLCPEARFSWLFFAERRIGPGDIDRVEGTTAPDSCLVGVGEQDIHNGASF